MLRKGSLSGVDGVCLAQSALCGGVDGVCVVECSALLCFLRLPPEAFEKALDLWLTSESGTHSILSPQFTRIKEWHRSALSLIQFTCNGLG